MAIQSHNHTQSVPSLAWEIKHSLGCNPCVDVNVLYEGAIHKILPAAVEYPDMGTVIVRFTSPRSGTARLA